MIVGGKMIAQDHASAPVRKSTRVLLICCLAIAVFLVLGTGAVQLGLFSQPQIENRSDWLQARFLAKSGVDAFAHWLTTNPDGLTPQEVEEKINQIVETHGGQSNPAGLQDVPEGSFRVMVSKQGNALKVQGEGSYRGETDTYLILLEKDSAGQWTREEVDK